MGYQKLHPSNPPFREQNFEQLHCKQEKYSWQCTEWSASSTLHIYVSIGLTYALLCLKSAATSCKQVIFYTSMDWCSPSRLGLDSRLTKITLRKSRNNKITVLPYIVPLFQNSNFQGYDVCILRRLTGSFIKTVRANQKKIQK